jgi:hypothetical protein
MREPSRKAVPPPCPGCRNSMRLQHTLPALGGLPELRSYRCFFCNEVLTEVVEDE